MRRFWVAAVLPAVALAFMVFPAAARAAPSLSASAAVLVEWHSGSVLYEKHGFQPRHPASLTKIVTALVAVKSGNLADIVEVSVRAGAVPGSGLGIAPGERFTLDALIWGLLLESGNDASIAIAEHVGGSVDAFAVMMNTVARELGAWSSQFKNPHGLTQTGHLTSPYDLALIAREFLKYPYLNRVVRSPTGVMRREHPRGELQINNTNRLLLSFSGADGVKTGTTAAAGECLIASATRDGMRLIAVVMDSQDRYRDAQALLSYGFSRYRLAWGGQKGQVARTVLVAGGHPGAVGLVLAGDLVGVVGPGDEELWVELDYEDRLSAPVARGTPLGTATLWSLERVVARVPLVAQGDVAKVTWWTRLLEVCRGLLRAAARRAIG